MANDAEALRADSVSPDSANPCGNQLNSSYFAVKLPSKSNNVCTEFSLSFDSRGKFENRC